MPKFFVKGDQISGEEITIIGQDVNHIINVLRMNEGDRVNICDINSKTNYVAMIGDVSDISATNDSIALKCKIVEKLESDVESNIHINIFQGLPKADKMEYIIQKNVEIGVNEITPVKMKRCIVKLDDKSATKKIDRWKQIALSAAKQSGRDYVPEVKDIIDIKDICNLTGNYDIVLLAYEDEKSVQLKEALKQFRNRETESLRIAVIIGPEGGLEESEVEMLKEAGVKSVSLGKRILRTETARISNVS
ncbi:MAG: 16S rRNA (uracil(1498)-N(3))-methyltransferase [Oscillospiraceae bacterium]|nr:16S rRNA (uracil(1498)-N(3))-methyltransferase [Oscillospiraceae bacterium]